MARKKKEVIKEEFVPSKYQKDIFDFIEHGNGNLVIEACAGSGKSTSLVKALDLISSDKKVLFCAFNKEIVKDLKKKIGKRDNITLTTVHSLGLMMINRNIENVQRQPNEYKYRSHIYSNLKNYALIDLNRLGKNRYVKYIANVNKLVEHGRNNLSQSINDLKELVYRHDIDLVGDEIDVALKVMEWGKENVDTVDFTDMVWLPNSLYLKPIGMLYDYIFVDEAQDLSVAQRELLLKLQKINTRYVFVGDSNQAIYSFASASPDSFRKLKSLPNTISLPLSISYRCDKNIVKFAQTLVNTIEYKENAEDGSIMRDCKLENVEDGDMILCRNNAPLVKIYNKLMRMGKKSFIKGKDIGANMKNLVKQTNQEELNINLDKVGVFSELYLDLFNIRDNVIKQNKVDYNTAMSASIVSSRLDIIKALETLSEGLKTASELILRIDSIFSDKESDGISLSTIHKAKGLEANNVFIACPSLMPSKSAHQDWEVEQEKNLMYVAYTRAKHCLGFLSEEGLEDVMKPSNENLKGIELSINIIYGKKMSRILLGDEDYAKAVVQRTTKSLTLPKKGECLKLGENVTNSGTTNINKLLTTKKLLRLKR